MFGQKKHIASITDIQLTFMFVSRFRKHCLDRTDSDWEAFSQNPADISFAALAFHLAEFTTNLNLITVANINFISRVKLTCLTTV